MPGGRRVVGEAALELPSVEMSYVPPVLVAQVWASQIDLIERGMAKGQSDWESADDLLGDILARKSQLWAAHRDGDVIAIAVIAVRSKKGITKLFVQLIAGTDSPQWADLLQSNLLRMKDKIGADCIEASCRPGLAKYLKNVGWSQKAIIMELI